MLALSCLIMNCLLYNSFQSLKHSTLQGKLLQQEGKQHKIASGSFWNGPDSVGYSVPEKAIKAALLSHKTSCEEDGDQTCCPKEDQPGRGLDQLSHLDNLQPVEAPAGFAVCAMFPAFVGCHPCWEGFSDSAIFESCLLLWLTPHLYFCK